MNRLWTRLSLVFAALILAVMIVVVLTPMLAFRFGERQIPPAPRDLEAPGGFVEELAAYYQTHGSWDGVDHLLRNPVGDYPLVPMRISVITPAGQIVYHGVFSDTQTTWWETLPIRTDGRTTVGYLEMIPVPPDFGRDNSHDKLSGRDRMVADLITRTLSLTVIVGGGLAILAGVLMSRSLTAPLNRLAKAARSIGARDLSHRVEIGGTQEMRDVGYAFNEMASGLEEAETLRRNLLADVAHELRTPLSVLQGSLRAILDDVYPLDKAEVATLYDQTRLLSRLITDLHELAQAEAGQLTMDFQPTNLARLTETTTATFLPVAEAKSITVTCQVPDELPQVMADANRISQVIHNLLTNALRHTPEGGSIEIHAGADEDAVWLSVRDTGEGIPADHLSHVFDRFYRVDSARTRAAGGTGLGLAIVRAIVEAHGGHVQAHSAGIPGQGSEFVVRLPRVSA